MAQAMIPMGMGLMGYVAAGQYSATVEAGKIQQIEAETAAEMEELSATQQEADRKGRLAEALSSQVAGAAAGGIASFAGSPLTILEADIKAEKKATQRGKFQTGLQATAFRTRGKMARKAARQQAKLGLLSTVGQMGMMTGQGLKPRG